MTKRIPQILIDLHTDRLIGASEVNFKPSDFGSVSKYKEMVANGATILQLEHFVRDCEQRNRDKQIKKDVEVIAQQIRAAGDNDFTPIKDYINSLS